MESQPPKDPSVERSRSNSCSSLGDWVEISTLDLGNEIHEGDARSRPLEKYPAKQHARSVRDQLGASEGLIYLPGLPSLSYEDSDQPVHFRQRRYFYYMSGINFSDCLVTYDISRDLLYAWIQPPRTGSNVIFNGPNPTREEVLAKYDFDRVEFVTDIDWYIDHFVSLPNSTIFLLHSQQGPQNVPIPSQATCIGPSTAAGHAVCRSQIDTVQLKPAMDAARSLKSSYEIKMTRQASQITAKAHTNVLRSIKNLTNEADIEAIFTATCIANQAKQQAYGVIAGSGANASTLHYIANDEPLKGRQLVCLDAGCEWQCYASDVTRTFPISGKFTKEAKEIYDIVAQMQEECIKMVKPGANYREIHLHAHKVAVKGLLNIGLLRGNFEELYASGASVAFFPHGLGHYLGLECHDYGDGGYLLYGFQTKPESWESAYLQMVQEPFTTPASILKPNHIITVEPGIYFSRYALEEVYLKDPKFAKHINRDLLEKYYPVGGVRIEDDILVTEDGYENLTTAPKGDEALRIINQGGALEALSGNEQAMRDIYGEVKEEKEDKRGWFS